MTRTPRRLAAAVTLIASALALACAPAATAGSLTAPPGGTNLTYPIDGRNLLIGAIAQEADGRLVYCMEAGKAARFSYTEELRVTDGDAARRIAWLAERHRKDRDARTHAAIGILVHDVFDPDQTEWARHHEQINARHDGLDALAERLMEEAGARMPSGVRTESSMVDGLRTGWVDASVTTASGAAIAGVRYTLRLEGPARFDAADGDGTTVSGVSGTSPVRHAWTATGAGEVKVHTTYDRAYVNQLVSEQDFIRFGGYDAVSHAGVSFRVRKDFTPAVATVASDRIVDAGGTVSDEVTSAVSGEDSHWVPGLELVADGWYFDDIPAARLVDAMSPDKGESARDFLDRIARRGYEPAAWGTATFTGPGQTVTATARTGDGDEYHAPARGGIGTWVWAFDVSRQSDEARQYVLADAVSGFLEYAETNSNRARVEVESSVTEHTAGVGAHLSDTIVVSGFPTTTARSWATRRTGSRRTNPLRR